jgi:hypothetical protein
MGFGLFAAIIVRGLVQMPSDKLKFAHHTPNKKALPHYENAVRE